MIKRIKKLIKKKFTKNYWQSGLSTKWHQKREDESYDDFEIFAQAVTDKIKNLNFDTVIEVGTGAGASITLLREKLDNHKNFIGVDINKKQIVENQNNYKNLNNVEFVHMDISKYIQSNDLNNVVIVSQNTLDYFEKNELEKLFLLIYNKIDNVSIAVTTLKENLELQDTQESKESDFKVYKHNYYKLLTSAGFPLVSIDSYGTKDNILVTGIKYI